VTVLVIGSNGYIGRHLIAGLAAAGLPALGASTSDRTGINPETGLLPKDFKISVEVKTVVYLAQSPRYREPGQASHILAVNVLSAVRAAVAARAAGAARFIYVSTGTVYAPSFEPLTEAAPLKSSDWYSLSKIQGEQAIQMFHSDMDVHVVRPFGIYGPGQRSRLMPNLIQSIRESRPITLQRRSDDLSDTDGLRISLCYVDDAVHALISLVAEGGAPYLNLASDEVLSIRMLAILLGEMLGKAPVLVTSDVLREFNLVANIDLLRKTMSPVFVPLSKGLAETVHGFQ
jgi:UDP-glucose 4-epimerase